MAAALLSRADAASCSQAAGPLPTSLPPISLTSASSGAAGFGSTGLFVGAAAAGGQQAPFPMHGHQGLLVPQLAAWPAAGEVAGLMHMASVPPLQQLPAAATGGMLGGLACGDAHVQRISFKVGCVTRGGLGLAW